MQDQATKTLATIFSEVLADLAFMFTEEEPGDVVPGTRWLETTIGYSGNSTGILRLRCPWGFSIHLAANLLGIDVGDDDIDKSAHDAVKEFMNIVCGQFLTAMFGTQELFSLTIPQSIELSEAPDMTLEEGTEECVCSVAGQFIQLTHLSGGAAALGTSYEL